MNVLNVVPVADKVNSTYKEIMNALNETSHGQAVQVEYHTVRNFTLDGEIKNLSDQIKNMSVTDIYNGDSLYEKIKDFFTNNIHGKYKNETYYVRKQNEEVEMNDASFILFDSEKGIRSVYVRNIISITINGVKYSR